MYVIFFALMGFIAGLDVVIKVRQKKTSVKKTYDSQEFLLSGVERRI